MKQYTMEDAVKGNRPILKVNILDKYTISSVDKVMVNRKLVEKELIKVRAKLVIERDRLRTLKADYEKKAETAVRSK